MAVYLTVSAGLTILIPTLMLALISTAYYGFTQFLPAFVGIFLVLRFSALGIAAGLISGDMRYSRCMGPVLTLLGSTSV